MGHGHRSNLPIDERQRPLRRFTPSAQLRVGWTRARGFGKAVARIVSGLAAEVDFAFTGIAQDRFAPMPGRAPRSVRSQP